MRLPLIIIFTLLSLIAFIYVEITTQSGVVCEDCGFIKTDLDKCKKDLDKMKKEFVENSSTFLDVNKQIRTRKKSLLDIPREENMMRTKVDIGLETLNEYRNEALTFNWKMEKDRGFTPASGGGDLFGGEVIKGLDNCKKSCSENDKCIGFAHAANVPAFGEWADRCDFWSKNNKNPGHPLVSAPQENVTAFYKDKTTVGKLLTQPIKLEDVPVLVAEVRKQLENVEMELETLKRTITRVETDRDTCNKSLGECTG